MKKKYLPKRQIKFKNEGKSGEEFHAEVDKLGNVNFFLWKPGAPRIHQFDIYPREVEKLTKWLIKVQEYTKR